jgi:hypothetical protein
VKNFYRLLIIAVIASLIGCTTPQLRDFADANLLIYVSSLPENWKIAESGKIDDEEGQISGAYINFYATNTPLFVRSSENIYHYSSGQKAFKHYQRMLALYQGVQARGTEWQTPTSFNYSSNLADQWHFACQNWFPPFGPEFGKERIICVLLARYEEFIVRFMVPMQVDDQQFFTVDQVELIVEAIDQKVKIYLQSDQ